MPSQHEALVKVENWIGKPLPPKYRAFLGAQIDDLSVGEFVLLYGTDSFIERNETYETKIYCPDHVTIGDDGGGSQLLLSLLGGSVSLVDAGSMNPQDAHAVAPNFEGWFSSGCPLPPDAEL